MLLTQKDFANATPVAGTVPLSKEALRQAFDSDFAAHRVITRRPVRVEPTEAPRARLSMITESGAELLARARANRTAALERLAARKAACTAEFQHRDLAVA